MLKQLKSSSGQSLVTLLVFVSVALIVTGAAVSLSITNARSATTYLGGERALEAAQSGAENALLQLLRNPNYSGETNLVVGNDLVDISVQTVGTTKTITAIGKAV